MKSKKKKFFKNKFQMVIYTIIFIVCIGLFIYIGCIDFTKDIDSESKKFSSLYKEVSDDNLYVFTSASEVLNLLNKEEVAVILFGFPTNKWTGYYANILNEVAKELKIDKLYYYDFYEDRKDSNGTYETIVNKLKVYAPVDDEGNQDIMAPTVVIVRNGVVKAYFDDTSMMKGITTPKEYYNENQIELIKSELKYVLEELK